nr:hypothetical protein [Terrabacter sp. Root181]
MTALASGLGADHGQEQAFVGVYQVSKAQAEPRRKHGHGFLQRDEPGLRQAQSMTSHCHSVAPGGKHVLHPVRLCAEVRADGYDAITPERANRRVSDFPGSAPHVLEDNQ